MPSPDPDDLLDYVDDITDTMETDCRERVDSMPDDRDLASDEVWQERQRQMKEAKDGHEKQRVKLERQ